MESDWWALVFLSAESAPSVAATTPKASLDEDAAHVRTPSVGAAAPATATAPADVDVSALEYVHNPIGALNEKWVRHLRAESAPVVLERFHELTGRRRAMLTKMIPEAWNALTQTPAGPDTYGRFMRIRVFDCWMHQPVLGSRNMEGPTLRCTAFAYGPAKNGSCRGRPNDDLFEM